MCLYEGKGTEIIEPIEEIKIAEEPIIVKKFIPNESYKFLWVKLWRSREFSLLHRYNRVLKSVKHLKIKGTVVKVIQDGFQVYSLNSKLKKDSSKYTEKCTVIPKGSEYCIGKFNEIMSNQIIVFSNMEKLNKYLEKNK